MPTIVLLKQWMWFCWQILVWRLPICGVWTLNHVYDQLEGLRQGSRLKLYRVYGTHEVTKWLLPSHQATISLLHALNLVLPVVPTPCGLPLSTSIAHLLYASIVFTALSSAFSFIFSSCTFPPIYPYQTRLPSIWKPSPPPFPPHWSSRFCCPLLPPQSSYFCSH